MSSRHIIMFCLLVLCMTGCKSAPAQTPDAPPIMDEQAARTSDAPTQDEAPEKVNTTNTGRIKLFDGEEEAPPSDGEPGEQPSLRISYAEDSEKAANGEAPQETESPEELYRRANKKLFENDPQGAIADCELALAAGQDGCHRIMGLAYKQLGDTQNACASFNKALLTGPANAEAIADQMKELACP